MTDRREFLKHILLGGAAALVAPTLSAGDAFGSVLVQPRAGAADAWAGVPQILKRISPPRFPKRDFVITKFGAVNGGMTDSTEAIRRAIEACSKAGGGRVVVPAGTYLSGAIHLRSNVNLHVS